MAEGEFHETANLAALGAALCWAASGLIAIGPVRAIGSVAFNRLRMSIVFVGTALAATLLGGWQTLDLQGAAILALSCWLAGNGALAWCAVDRAVEADPDNSLARLVTELLTRAVPPSSWDRSWSDQHEQR